MMTALSNTFHLSKFPLIVALVAIFASVMRADTSTPNAALAQYRAWQETALEGDVDEIDAIIEKLEAQLEQQPDNELARVYLGSICAIRSKESFWGMTKLDYLKRADKLMNAAVTSAPDNPRIRMIRAISLYKLPERFDKRPVAIKDFEILVPIAKQPDSPLTQSEKQAILYYASLTYEEAGMPGSMQLKADCHALDPGSKYGQLTQ